MLRSQDLRTSQIRVTELKAAAIALIAVGTVGTIGSIVYFGVLNESVRPIPLVLGLMFFGALEASGVLLLTRQRG
jgi:hypothetical protein